MFLSEWREFPSAPCLAGKKNLMTARASMLLKSCASLTCFRACFLPGRAKDLSAPWYYQNGRCTWLSACTNIISVASAVADCHLCKIFLFNVLLCQVTYMCVTDAHINQNQYV